MVARKRAPKKGRKRISISAEMRRAARAAAGYGMKDEQIATMLGIGESTLKRKCAAELASGRVDASAKVQQTAFQMATSGKLPAMTIFWLKCRAGWKEPTLTEHTGKDGGPIETIVRVVRVPVAPPKHDDDD